MDDFVQESLIKQALKPLVGEAAAHRSFRFQQVMRPVPDNVQIFGGIVRPGPALILS